MAIHQEHPRIRGDHIFRLIGLPHVMGPSPHTRGSLNKGTLNSRTYGNIPAYAGITFPGRRPCHPSWEHPRIRGDHFSPSDCKNSGPGTSPHTRGSLGVGAARRRVLGNIPAYAGITSPRAASSRGRGEHPRIRGDHQATGETANSKTGTSPHTRGSLGVGAARRRVLGNIPAYAGITRGWCGTPTCTREHPRIRGDHEAIRGMIYKLAGTSPHTRGSQLKSLSAFTLLGNIPAYAGITACKQTTMFGLREHPRIRGDHWMRDAGADAIPGTSPHTRGSLCAYDDLIS